VYNEQKQMGNKQRVQYCHWFRDFNTVNGKNILYVILFFIDDAWFHPSEYVNTLSTDLVCFKNMIQFADVCLHPCAGHS
jgi:hypothetical protein